MGGILYIWRMYNRHILLFVTSISFLLSISAQQTLPDSLQKAIDTAKSKSDLAYAYREAGQFYYELYNMEGYNKAASYFEKGRTAASETNDSMLIAISYLSLAQVYDAIGDDKLPKALGYYTLHQKSAIIENDTPVVMRTYMNIASVQSRMELPDATKMSLKKLNALADNYLVIKTKNRCYVFSAFICSQLNDLIECRRYFKKINTAQDSITNGGLAYRKFYFLTRFYLFGQQNEYDSAMLAGQEALKEVNNLSDSTHIYRLIAKYAKEIGNFRKAYFYANGEMELYRRMISVKSYGDASNTLLRSELNLQEENTKLLVQKEQAQRKLNRWLIGSLAMIIVGLMCIFYLAHQRRMQNAALISQVAENKLLLQELHHRVKNNLQIVSSFMLLQQIKKNGNSEELTKQLQSKIQALALIHQQLHQQNSFVSIELQPYFEQLVAETLAIHTDGDTEISFSVNTRNLFLNLDTITPLALITTELLLNSVKYVAINSVCIINISAEKQENSIQFIYTDNGPGLPTGLDFETASTTGLRLVKRLAKQMKALVIVNNNKSGLSYKIEFPC